MGLSFTIAAGPRLSCLRYSGFQSLYHSINSW
jgi:hypothetical protein